MITSLIGPNGRLGNQMFQYAALIGIANKQGLEYGIDYRRADSTSWKEFPIDNTFSLMTIDKPFNLSAKCCVAQYPPCIESNREFHFQERFFRCGDNAELQGYFQTEKYFNHCQDIIRKEFTFKSEIIEEAKKFLSDKSFRETVSIHIRRGDYVTAPWHGVCESSYYEKAVATYFSDKPYNFIVITDDVSWAKKNIAKSDNIHICDVGNQYLDLCIMSICDHNIIANSSFSWWASWLNTNLNKKAVAPKAWFNPTQHLASLNTKDIYCEGWKVI